MIRASIMRRSRRAVGASLCILSIVFLGVLGAAPLRAQETRRDSTRDIQSHAQAPRGGARRGGDADEGGPRGPQAPYIMPPILQAALADPHNKLIHFPIVLSLVAAVMVIVARRRPQYEPVAFWTLWFAMVFTLAAYFSGLYQAQEFLHRPKRWLVDTHMRWGIGLAFAQCVWMLTLIRPRTRAFATWWSLVVVALVVVTGFLGGLVAHSRGAPPPGAKPGGDVSGIVRPLNP